MSEEDKRWLQAIARGLLGMCDGDIRSITVHADVEDNDPYTSVRAWGSSPNEPIYEWFEFVEEKEGGVA